MRTVQSSEMSVKCRIIYHHIQEDSVPHSRRCKNHKFDINLFAFEETQNFRHIYEIK